MSVEEKIEKLIELTKNDSIKWELERITESSSIVSD